jgi:hypothetical protein
MISNNCFTQLNLDFSNFVSNLEKKEFLHSYGGESSISYYSIDQTVKESIIESLPTEIKNLSDKVRVVEVTGRHLSPHIDRGVKVNINYYIQPAAAKTIFYTVNQGAVARKYRGKITSNDNVYQLKDITEICNFVAEKNSCYLVNTGNVHSVLMTNNSIRYFLQVAFDEKCTYNEVYSIMQNLNLIKD